MSGSVEGDRLSARGEYRFRQWSKSSGVAPPAVGEDNHRSGVAPAVPRDRLPGRSNRELLGFGQKALFAFAGCRPLGPEEERLGDPSRGAWRESACGPERRSDHAEPGMSPAQRVRGGVAVCRIRHGAKNTPRWCIRGPLSPLSSGMPTKPAAMPAFQQLTAPTDGSPITLSNGLLQVPDVPIIPFIEGDGTGPDIWRASQHVLDSAVRIAYGGKRRLAWFEVFAGEKAKEKFDSWLPEDTITAINHFLVAIKGPLTTPVGGGFRSLNVALRQQLDLYACVRPVRWFTGVPSPVKDPGAVNMVIYRENTEDIYAGIEYEAHTPAAKKLIRFLQDEMGVKNIRFPDSSAIGIKPVSEEGSKRLIRAAIKFAIAQGLPSVTLVHKGNIMKYTEGGFRDWGYELAKEEFGAVDYEGGPWQVLPNGIIIKDVIADAMLQQVLTRPREYSVLATLNLNGDYISDALAAQVGGIGIAPGANINYVSGHAIFEATHGTAPKYANKDMVNPGSVILSGEMMLRYLGWNEAADLILDSLAITIGQKRVTYDFERQMDGATKLSTSGFGAAMVENMGPRA